MMSVSDTCKVSLAVQSRLSVPSKSGETKARETRDSSTVHYRMLDLAQKVFTNKKPEYQRERMLEIMKQRLHEQAKADPIWDTDNLTSFIARARDKVDKILEEFKDLKLSLLEQTGKKNRDNHLSHSDATTQQPRSPPSQHYRLLDSTTVSCRTDESTTSNSRIKLFNQGWNGIRFPSSISDFRHSKRFKSEEAKLSVL
uniref:Uncharacterized protein n=1 Tax=Ditylenchus dipsaci TaxID=166011 RepID=A0A915DHL0_9BILA